MYVEATLISVVRNQVLTSTPRTCLVGKGAWGGGGVLPMGKDRMLCL